MLSYELSRWMELSPRFSCRVLLRLHDSPLTMDVSFRMCIITDNFLGHNMITRTNDNKLHNPYNTDRKSLSVFEESSLPGMECCLL
jgi:hypothetical protein